jgi:hypothetical protein
MNYIKAFKIKIMMPFLIALAIFIAAVITVAVRENKKQNNN